MAKVILGSYPTEEEAITAANVHALAGLQSKNITLFTNEEKAKTLEDHTNVTVKTDTPQLEDGSPPSLLDKILNALSDAEDFELYSEEKLKEYGLTAEEAEQCLYDAEYGKIVVLADDELRMGHNDPRYDNIQ